MPTAQIDADNQSAMSGTPLTGRTKGGPIIANVVRSRARRLRSTTTGVRRNTVSTTTSASLASSRRPVRRPVSRKFAPIRTAMNEKSATMMTRAAASA